MLMSRVVPETERRTRTRPEVTAGGPPTGAPPGTGRSAAIRKLRPFRSRIRGKSGFASTRARRSSYSLCSGNVAKQSLMKAPRTAQFHAHRNVVLQPQSLAHKKCGSGPRYDRQSPRTSWTGRRPPPYSRRISAQLADMGFAKRRVIGWDRTNESRRRTVSDANASVDATERATCLPVAMRASLIKVD
jgi:hypothetical protein